MKIVDASPHQRNASCPQPADRLPRHCDVAVVGGGPGGACAAYALASQGIDVALLERELLPRYKACGGGLVHRVHDFLPVDAETAIERRCRAAEVNLMASGQHFVTHRQEPIVSTTMRASFDWLLVEAAARAGARVIYPCEVLAIASHRYGVDLTTHMGQVHAHFVIAAHGAAGRLSRLGGWRDHCVTAPALEWEVRVPPEVFDRFSQTARFDIGAVANGYGWVFPKRAHLSVGIGVLNPARRTTQTLKKSLRQYLAAIGVAPLIEVQQHGYVVPLTTHKAPLMRDRVMLVGDSAGLADPLTGEGISNAVISGRLAGEALAAGALNPERVMAHYQERMDGMILRELRSAHYLARLLYATPALSAASLFGSCGARLTERVTDVFMGERRYTEEVDRRISLLRKLCKWGQRQAGS